MAKVREIEFFEHVAGALVDVAESDKLDRIRAIEKSGKAVEHFVLRHGLTERAAFEVEAAVIDFIGIPNLSNLQAGHYSSDLGSRPLKKLLPCIGLRHLKQTNRYYLSTSTNCLIEK